MGSTSLWTGCPTRSELLAICRASIQTGKNKNSSTERANMFKEGIKIIHANLENFDEIEVYPISDLHWSDQQTDESRFLKFVEYILDKPNRFVILNGDLLDMALTVSVSDTYSERYSPSESVDSLAIHLQRIRHRVLAVGTGNHEDRVYKYTGIDVSEHLVMKSGISLERYANNSFVLFIQFGKDAQGEKICYSLFAHHGVGGGRMKGGKINMVVRMNQIVNTDIFLVGHVHDLIETTTKSFIVDPKTMTLEEFTQYYMIANPWQRYGGYGQKFAFAPASIEIGYFVLSGKKKKINMVVGVDLPDQ